jgi:hypothetical protein
MKEVRSPGCAALDPDDVAPPNWNGAACAGAVRWGAQQGLPPSHRLLLVCLGLISDDDGLVGVVSNAELANATGAPLNDIEAARAWLVRRGGLVEIPRHDGAQILFIGRSVLAATPTAELLDAATAARPLRVHRPGGRPRIRPANPTGDLLHTAGNNEGKIP